MSAAFLTALAVVAALGPSAGQPGRLDAANGVAGDLDAAVNGSGKGTGNRGFR